MKFSSKRVARLLLGGVIAVAAVELVTAAVVYRERIDGDDWEALRSTLAALPPELPVVLADRWLGPRARMEVPALAAPASVAPPDFAGVPRVAVVSLDAEPEEVLEGQAEAFELRKQTEAGAFTVSVLEARDGLETVANWLDPSTARSLQVSIGGERCRSKTDWRCRAGRVSTGYAEVGYEPRRCLLVEASDNEDVVLRAEAMSTGDRLRGHVGFTNFNGRLRSDGPVRVTVRLDDMVVGRFVATDAEGWRAFEVPVEPGRHDVEVTLGLTVGGTYGAQGYTSRPSRPVCFELRSLGRAP